MRAAAGSLRVGLQYSTGATGCDKNGRAFVTLNTWTLDAATGFEVGEIPLTSFTGATLTKINGITFSAPILLANVEITIRSISFAFESVLTQPPTTPTTPILVTDFRTLNTNQLGFYQDHDGTLTAYRKVY